MKSLRVSTLISKRSGGSPAADHLSTLPLGVALLHLITVGLPGSSSRHTCPKSSGAIICVQPASPAMINSRRFTSPHQNSSTPLFSWTGEEQSHKHSGTSERGSLAGCDSFRPNRFSRSLLSCVPIKLI